MHPKEGRRQKTLYRATAELGETPIGHGALYPVFGADYKVRGIIGYNLDDAPVWYHGAPAAVDGRTLRFKSFDAGPLAMAEWPPGMLEGCYFCDPWQVLGPALMGNPEAGLPGAGDVGTWLDLFERRIGAGTIIDLVFEAPLHRLRGLIVRRGRFYRTKALSILEIPALPEALLPELVVKRRGRRRRGTEVG